MEHYQSIINIIGAGVMAGIGWWCRKIWDLIDKAEDKIHQIEIDLPKHYQRKDELEARFEKLEKRFDKLDDHITRLFDRIESKGL